MVLKRFVLSSSHQMLKNQEIINQVSFQQREQQISAFLKLFRYIKHLRRNHMKFKVDDSTIIKKFINSQLDNLFSKNKQFKQSDIQQLAQKLGAYLGLQNSIKILSSEVKLDPGEICSDLFFQIFGQKQLVSLEEFKFTIFSNIMPKLIEKNEQQIILDLVNLLPKNENNQFSLFQISCLIRDMVEGYPR
ncbi:hypothetical protein PPERSA_07043 [Pseudocohnilembus persalinus]|uniref:Uncharacterized protein n=1 Tax=Pseudocohnilembus persalinus TaxID=266149 RepID=A0A0V0QLM6_PSEPJ|nr:hypothetical protein PPERSA_07043 [Pseudocohnilembus persalinus]|eukprot:KRX03215.1 hypothetical protein PPERSA_07043 [Pseudocohnilembus persalinus]